METQSQTLGRCVVITGPSCAGKTTLLRKMLKAVPDSAQFISLTTRAPRAHEREGDDYHFVTKEEFERLREGEHLLEWTEVYGEFYGTVREELHALRLRHPVVFAPSDIAGMRSYRERVEGVVIVMVVTPVETIERRLRKSRPELTDARREKRLGLAAAEMACSDEADIVVSGDDGHSDQSVLTILAYLGLPN